MEESHILFLVVGLHALLIIAGFSITPKTAQARLVTGIMAVIVLVLSWMFLTSPDSGQGSGLSWFFLFSVGTVGFLPILTLASAYWSGRLVKTVLQ